MMSAAPNPPFCSVRALPASELFDLKPADPCSDTGTTGWSARSGQLRLLVLAERRVEGGGGAWLGLWESIAWWTEGQCNQGNRMKRTGKPAEPAPARPTESFGIGCLLLFILLRGNRRRPATAQPHDTASQAAQQGLSFTRSPHTSSPPCTHPNASAGSGPAVCIIRSPRDRDG